MANWHDSDRSYGRTMRWLEVARWTCIAVILGSGFALVFIIAYMIYGLVA
jgi:hypothetical protein